MADGVGVGASADYQRVEVPQRVRHGVRDAPAAKFWRQFPAPASVQHFGPVTHAEFDPRNARSVAATTSTRVTVRRSVIGCGVCGR